MGTVLWEAVEVSAGFQRAEVGGGGSTGEDRPNTIAYNNAYMEERWALFKHAGAMRLITRKASAAGVELPSSPVDPKCKACPAYHIKGMCNTGCGNVGDHVTHTRCKISIIL